MIKKLLVISVIFLGLLVIGLVASFAWINQSAWDNQVKIASPVNLENFDRLDQAVWSITDKSLGRTWLNPANIEVNNGFLKIRMPANRLEGGEIVNRGAVSYGRYESRMKLPSVPSSITGFFLYAPPDYFYEIDIEIHNTTEGKLLLTTYADGEVQNEYEGVLGFDPTADFHNYRFDYTADQVAFYVDDQFITAWQDGFPKGEPMQLMVNSWYPNWLAGTPTPTDQVLLVDWIRY
ncbi:glycoside hydrolase family 16 protein [Acetobacterium wieringae]|uniref:glycoside hydrolase family 16 protein n=1 Tax=Acetobacterium wieringae TaxID=52694 RepID=UPI002B20552B|nr:glycoside hydrolase family 16 protein [Acetobacterium wieringae]MEA4807015.1 glycoside hydrolase family 16 protein [Acetobacterium wieringae]